MEYNMAVARCPNCNQPNTGLPQEFHDLMQCDMCGKMFIAEIKAGRARKVSPAAYVLDLPQGMDPQLAADIIEACACFNVGAYRATVVMTRRFLEALLDKRGFKGRTLVERIKSAYDSKAVTPLAFQLASSTRILGNYGAHYSDDELSQIGLDEAELVLNMVRQIIKSLGGPIDTA
jgi:Domain of unknown function (DUF4145)